MKSRVIRATIMVVILSCILCFGAQGEQSPIFRDICFFKDLEAVEDSSIVIETTLYMDAENDTEMLGEPLAGKLVVMGSYALDGHEGDVMLFLPQDQGGATEMMFTFDVTADEKETFSQLLYNEIENEWGQPFSSLIALEKGSVLSGDLNRFFELEYKYVDSDFDMVAQAYTAHWTDDAGTMVLSLVRVTDAEYQLLIVLTDAPTDIDT